jgi:RNA polymerase sigma factor (sigma-70 family)
VEELKSLVVRAQAGDLEAYGEVVRRFQDLAYGYAYSVLGDFHLAEDAAQEAFIEAYRCLANLREPAAFPGWFRRIVFKHCDRITRQRLLEEGAAGEVAVAPSPEPSPPDVAERREMRDTVLQAVRALPEDQRTATTLFYINGYSQKEIADFLEVPVTTVNNRLHTSRRRLKERMLGMVENELQSSKPGAEFRALVEKAIALHEQFRNAEAIRVHQAAVKVARGKGVAQADLADSYWRLIKAYYGAERQSDFAEAMMAGLPDSPAPEEAQKVSERFSEAATAFLRGGQPERAIEAARRALKAAEKCTEPTGHHTARIIGLGLLHEAAQNSGNEAEAKRLLDEVHHEAEECAVAFQAAENPADVAQEVSSRLTQAGMCLAHGGQPERAIEAYKRALTVAEKCKERTDYHNERISGLCHLCEALIAAENEGDADKVQTEIYDELRICEEELAAACPGLQTITDTVEEVPKRWFQTVSYAYYTAGQHFGFTCKKPEALRTMRRAMDLFFQPDFLPDLAAWTLSVEGDRDKALALVKRAVEEAPYQFGFLRKIFREWDDFEPVREDPEFLEALAGR